MMSGGGFIGSWCFDQLVLPAADGQAACALTYSEMCNTPFMCLLPHTPFGGAHRKDMLC